MSPTKECHLDNDGHKASFDIPDSLNVNWYISASCLVVGHVIVLETVIFKCFQSSCVKNVSRFFILYVHGFNFKKFCAMSLRHFIPNFVRLDYLSVMKNSPVLIQI